METYENRRDKYAFQKLSREFLNDDELEFYIASAFFIKPKTWIRELVTQAAYDEYMVRKRIQESINYHIESDLDKIGIHSADDLKRALKIEDAYPVLFQHMIQKTIEPETVIGIDILTDCLNKWSTTIKDTIIFPSWKRRLKRYNPFLKIDVPLLTKSVKNYLCQNK